MIRRMYINNRDTISFGRYSPSLQTDERSWQISAPRFSWNPQHVFPFRRHGARDPHKRIYFRRETFYWNVALSGTPEETDGPLPPRRAAPVGGQQGSESEIRGGAKWLFHKPWWSPRLMKRDVVMIPFFCPTGQTVPSQHQSGGEVSAAWPDGVWADRYIKSLYLKESTTPPNTPPNKPWCLKLKYVISLVPPRGAGGATGDILHTPGGLLELDRSATTG